MFRLFLKYILAMRRIECWISLGAAAFGIAIRSTRRFAVLQTDVTRRPPRARPEAQSHRSPTEGRPALSGGRQCRAKRNAPGLEP